MEGRKDDDGWKEGGREPEDGLMHGDTEMTGRRVPRNLYMVSICWSRPTGGIPCSQSVSMTGN